MHTPNYNNNNKCYFINTTNYINRHFIHNLGLLVLFTLPTTTKVTS
jgi:hypothetical protein